jgi:DNA topoisomerase-2
MDTELLTPAAIGQSVSSRASISLTPHSVLQVPGFLVEFITPIVKAVKGKQSIPFYTLPEYDAWKESLGGTTKGWAVKYYKGLGTSTAAEAKEYFADLEFHRKGFAWECDGDGDLIEMAFSKKAADKRKTWLRAFTEGTFLDHSVSPPRHTFIPPECVGLAPPPSQRAWWVDCPQHTHSSRRVCLTLVYPQVSEVKYSDFINHELILFSRADLQRSIPALLDGFKPGQRKILFAAFKRKLRTDLKVRERARPLSRVRHDAPELTRATITPATRVTQISDPLSVCPCPDPREPCARASTQVAQLAGYVAEHSAYHHGEASLMTTIVGLAQSFCGSNNINVLVPSGQFGTRIMGGKDHASPRYIFTRLAPLTRVLFPECDDQLLHFLDDDGQKIEPDYYLPILPMVLVNGADGIGTGWSTSIPNYNPRDIVDNLKRLLSGEQVRQGPLRAPGEPLRC